MMTPSGRYSHHVHAKNSDILCRMLVAGTKVHRFEHIEEAVEVQYSRVLRMIL